MTLTLTTVDSTYHANDAAGHKEHLYSVSATNPYTAAGEVLTLSLFRTQFRGGYITMISPAVGIDTAGILATGRFRGDASSTAAPVLQFYNAGLSGTNKAGLFVDNTVANISGGTFHMVVKGH